MSGMNALTALLGLGDSGGVATVHVKDAVVHKHITDSASP